MLKHDSYFLIEKDYLDLIRQQCCKKFVSSDSTNEDDYRDGKSQSDSPDKLRDKIKMTKSKTMHKTGLSPTKKKGSQLNLLNGPETHNNLKYKHNETVK